MASLNMKQYLATLTLLFMYLMPKSPSFASETTEAKAALPRTPTIVRHAGGSIDNQTYTNSIKAIESSISKGSFLIEIDLLPTRDGDWFCFHDYRELWPKGSNWARFDVSLQRWLARLPKWSYPAHSIYPSTQQLQERIKSAQDTGGLVHCTLSDLQSLSARYPQAIFITDTKYNNYALMDRIRTLANPSIIPQVYNIDEYEYAKSAGFKRIVYTLYKRGNFNPLLNILKDQELWKIVFPAPWLCKDSPALPPNWINRFKGEILVHTINHPSELCSNSIRVDGYYSDSIFQSTQNQLNLTP